MISIDFESGQIFVGDKSVPVDLTGDEGHLHINHPDGPVLKSLTVLERLRVIQYALTANNAPASLAASILHEATVKPGVGDYRLHEAIALHMAGGGLKAPPIYQSISMVARHTGWHPDDIFSAEAAQIDRMAAALAPSSSSDWTRVLMLGAGQDELEAYTNDLATSLIDRMDDSGIGVYSDDIRNRVDEGYFPKADNSLDSTGDFPSSEISTEGKNTVVKGLKSSRSIRTDSSDYSASKVADRYSKHSKSPDSVDLKSSSDLKQNYMKKTNELLETDNKTSDKEEALQPLKKKSAPAGGLGLKKQRHRRLKPEVSRGKMAIKAKKFPPANAETKHKPSGPGPTAIENRSDLNLKKTPESEMKDKVEREIVLKKHIDHPQKPRADSNLKAVKPQAEKLPVHGIADDLPAGDISPQGHIHSNRQPVEPEVRRLPPQKQQGAAAVAAGRLDREFAAFFRHREATVAEELAEILNREADLRGID